MGSSLPPPAAIDLVSSFARRRGADVEIVLAEPELSHGNQGLSLRLSKGRVSVPATAELVEPDGAQRLVARFPRSRLTDGTWSLVLETAGADRPERVDARLLVQGDRPLVLLWGATRQSSRLPDRRAWLTSTRRAAAAGGAALDRVLEVLPPERAATVRARARTLARRVLR